MIRLNKYDTFMYVISLFIEFICFLQVEKKVTKVIIGILFIITLLMFICKIEL